MTGQTHTGVLLQGRVCLAVTGLGCMRLRNITVAHVKVSTQWEDGLGRTEAWAPHAASW
jgi:hypothetical protein